MRVWSIVLACALVIGGCTDVAPRVVADGGPIGDAARLDAIASDAGPRGDAGMVTDTGVTTSCFGVASTSMALTVQQAVAAVGCSTSVAAPLSQQLVEEINCLAPGTLSRIDGIAGVTTTSAVIPWLQTPAANDLAAAVSARGGTLPLTSALRTLPQQLMLYRWYQMGACGITLAASPGSSPHERGLAVDTGDYAAWQTALEANHWRWHGAGDLVHYDYVGGGVVDLAGRSVLAFQTLWNLNNPTDMISADGAYGPATEARVLRAPTEGFPIGPSCGVTHVPFAIDWTLDRGEYVFTARASSNATSVEYSADGRVLGTVQRTASAVFSLRAGICDDGHDHPISARALDASGTEVEHGVGLFQALSGAAVYIKPTDIATFEIGIERATTAMAAIEVDADGTPVTDATSLATHSTRLAVLHTYSTLGLRTFVVRIYDASGAVIDTRTVMLTLR